MLDFKCAAPPWCRSSRFLLRCQLLGLHTDEGVIQRGQRVEVSGLDQIFVCFVAIALGLIRLTQAVQVSGILEGSLLQLRDGFVLVLLAERDPALPCTEL